MSKKQRRLKNFLIIPKLQLRLCGFTLLVLFMCLAVTSTILNTALDELFTILIQTSRAEAEAQAAVAYAYSYMTKTLVLTMSVVFFISSTCALILSHRIAGAAYAINRFVSEKLLGGNYEERLKLRKNDFFLDIADNLNSLAEKLESAATPAKRRAKAR